MKASWKVALIVLGVVLVGSGLFFKLIVAPANKARQIAGGYRGPAEAQAALLKSPNDAFAHITLANNAQRRQDHVAALQEWRDAVRLDPQNGYSQSERAMTLLSLHRRNEAKKVFAALAQTNHENAPFAAQMLKKLK